MKLGVLNLLLIIPNTFGSSDHSRLLGRQGRGGQGWKGGKLSRGGVGHDGSFHHIMGGFSPDLVNVDDICLNDQTPEPCLSHKRRSDDDEETFFVCRNITHPITGESRLRTMCIPADAAWASDGCTCCDGNCPAQPEFVDLGCSANLDSDSMGLDTTVQRSAGGDGGRGGRGGRGRHGHGGNFDRVTVCRELVNPFTGDRVNVTVTIPAHHTQQGDTCGCCNDVCPEPGEEKFPRPDTVPIPCGEGEIETCETRQDGPGGFVCRSVFKPGTGENITRSVCIPTDSAWDMDTCGCCEEECPERPISVVEQCEEQDQEEVLCPLKRRNNGSGEDVENGIFVSREMFHHNGEGSTNRTLCVPPSKGWITDSCGCCGGDCPMVPEGGYDTEDDQLVALALEVDDENIMLDADPTIDMAESSSGAATHTLLVLGALTGAVGLVLS